MYINTETVKLSLDDVTKCFNTEEFTYPVYITRFFVYLALKEVNPTTESGSTDYSQLDKNQYKMFVSLFTLLIRGYTIGISEGINNGTFNLNKLREYSRFTLSYCKRWEKIAIKYRRDGGIPLPSEVNEIIVLDTKSECEKNKALCKFYKKSKYKVEERVSHFISMGYYMYLAK